MEWRVISECSIGFVKRYRSKEQIITYEGHEAVPGGRAAYRGQSSRRRAAPSPPRRCCSWREHAGRVNRAHTDRRATCSTGRHREGNEAVGDVKICLRSLRG